MQTWPAVLRLNSSTCGVSCEWDSCQTFEDTSSVGSGCSENPRFLLQARQLLVTHLCATFCLLLLHCIYLYLCAQHRHSSAKGISFHILTTGSQEKNLNLPGAVNSPKSWTEKEAERDMSIARCCGGEGYLSHLQMSSFRLWKQTGSSGSRLGGTYRCCLQLQSHLT